MAEQKSMIDDGKIDMTCFEDDQVEADTPLYLAVTSQEFGLPV